MSTTIYKNVLLVGGAGDLGKHILSALLADQLSMLLFLLALTQPPHFHRM